MNQELLQKEFQKYKDQFLDIKNRIESNTVKNEYYRGPFYEVVPFSYQRDDYKQGKLITQESLFKNIKNSYIYSFNKEGQIIEIAKGMNLPNSYYYQFLFYSEECLKSLSFDNNKSLLSITFYLFNSLGYVDKMYSRGKYGGFQENYIYDENNVLKEIEIRQFDKNFKEANPIRHIYSNMIQMEI